MPAPVNLMHSSGRTSATVQAKLSVLLLHAWPEHEREFAQQCQWPLRHVEANVPTSLLRRDQKVEGLSALILQRADGVMTRSLGLSHGSVDGVLGITQTK